MSASAEQDWESRLVRERGVGVTVWLAVMCLALWPTDAWVFASLPEARPLMGAWRVGSVTLAAATAAALSVRSPLSPLHVAVGAMLAWTGWTSACMGRIRVEHLPLCITASALAFILVPLPLRPRARAVAHVAALVVSMIAFFSGSPAALADSMFLLAIVIGGTFSACAFVGGHLVYRLEHENQQQRVALAEANARAHRLLHNVLPARVADKLEREPVAIAERCDDVVVLFADIVGFTPRSASMTAAEVVALLDQIFSTFDRLTEQHGLEKIKTIGDAYMAAAGLPESPPDPAGRAAELALAMRDAMAGLGGLSLRIGLHAGPAVAGVLGVRKFSYDLWGDTVNTASRMESHGAPGRVHVSRELRDRLADRYAFEACGLQQIKGKGEMETFFLERRSADQPT